MAHTPAGQTRARIAAYMRKRLWRGESPTVREVQAAFGFRSVGSAREQLEALVQAGILRKEPGRARGFHLPRLGPPPLAVPLLGKVQAGSLQLALEQAAGFVSVQSRFPEAELFALRVRGESMRDAGIFPGDVVIVRKQPSARTGDLVVALVGEEATVKTLRLFRGRVELHPANPDFAVQIYKPQEVQIVGKVLEVRRYLEEDPAVRVERGE